MRKFAIAILLTFISTVLAGIYGAIHDQVTYSISKEYFTVFKFDQFGFSDWGHQSPRLTTAIIGFLATWWFGLAIGVFQGVLGLIHQNYKTMLKFGMNAIFITFSITIIFGLLGFIIGKIDSTNAMLKCCFPYQIYDKESFVVVGSIHNFGYTGGLVGTVAGFAYQLYKKKVVA